MVLAYTEFGFMATNLPNYNLTGSAFSLQKKKKMRD